MTAANRKSSRDSDRQNRKDDSIDDIDSWREPRNNREDELNKSHQAMNLLLKMQVAIATAELLKIRAIAGRSSHERPEAERDRSPCQ